MAFHDRLSRTQQILLAIFCFPLLPFYLCYLRFAKSEKDNGKSDTLGKVSLEGEEAIKAQTEEKEAQEISKQPRFTGQADTPDGQLPNVTFEPDQGYSVTVEIHPRQPTPQIENKATFRKGNRVFPNVTGQDNKGFQGDGERQLTLSTEQDLHVYPWDKSSLKSMPVDLQQFKKLDAYASKVNVRSSVQNLVSVLLQEANSDLEKVRAIWTWICHHIEYDVEGYRNRARASCEPADVLRSGKSICAGYAGLFEQMCSFAGIQCKKLSGYSKGYGYTPGQVFEGDADHAWNAVHLDGRWHLLDSTWGSGSVDRSCGKFTFRYVEFYFLTHPALFVNDHFPEDHEWQLLKPTLTLQQFGHNIRCRPEFYSTGLIAASPATTVIETENGKATVLIKGRSPALFLSDLNGVKENCLMMLQKNGMMLEVYPQQTGTHSLNIFAKPSKDKEASYRHVLEYSLKCSSVDNSICLPKALIQPVGPSWHSEERGILKALPSGPVIHTDDGRCLVTFTQSKDLDIFATLDSDTSSVPENTRRRHIWKTCQGNQVELKIHLPHVGAFALHIWAKKTSDPGDHHCILSYLLSCPNQSVMWPVFPVNYTDWQDGFELVAPLAGVLPANRKVQFKLKLPGIAQASVKCGESHPLALSQDGFWEGDCHTSGNSAVIVTASKTTGNTFWYLLKYQVESH